MVSKRILSASMAAFLALSSAASLSCGTKTQETGKEQAKIELEQRVSLEKMLSEFSGEEVASISHEVVTETFSHYDKNEIRYYEGILKDGKTMREYHHDYAPQYILKNNKLIFNGAYGGVAGFGDPAHFIDDKYSDYFVPFMEVFDNGKLVKQYGAFFHIGKERDSIVGVIRLPDENRLLLNSNRFRITHPDVVRDNVENYKNYVPQNMQVRLE